jgi:hypothetical protein
MRLKGSGCLCHGSAMSRIYGYLSRLDPFSPSPSQRSRNTAGATKSGKPRKPEKECRGPPVRELSVKVADAREGRTLDEQGIGATAFAG